MDSSDQLHVAAALCEGMESSMCIEWQVRWAPGPAGCRNEYKSYYHFQSDNPDIELEVITAIWIKVWSSRLLSSVEFWMCVRVSEEYSDFLKTSTRRNYPEHNHLQSLVLLPQAQDWLSWWGGGGGNDRKKNWTITSRDLIFINVTCILWHLLQCSDTLQ
jgi:hypothetical protein